MKGCVISKLPARGQLAETTLLNIFAGSTNLIISPSATSKKAAPSSDMRKYINQQYRVKMLHINTFTLKSRLKFYTLRIMESIPSPFLMPTTLN